VRVEPIVLPSAAVRCLSVLAALAVTLGVHAAPSDAEAGAGPTYAWCAPELDALPGNVCHFDGNAEGGRRTLVILLHGLIARNTNWQWTQERAIARDAKQFHFAAIVPQAPELGPGGSAGYGWPGGAPKATVEDELVKNWMGAKKLLEERAGKPFDEVFVLGFSSGAYYASSLALRGRLDVDGYGVFAGATSSGPPTKDDSRRAPIFVGVCARDKATAPDSRAFGYTLSTLAWPHKTDELSVGHMFADNHIGHALTYLRGRKDATR
jgi:predicted esterase